MGLGGAFDIGNKGWVASAWLVGVLVIMMPLSVWLFERRAKA